MLFALPIGLRFSTKGMSFIISRISGNVPSAKYLGITITEKMYWVQHISDISSKSTEILGFLRRNLAFAPRTTKKVAYKTLVAYALNWSMQHLFGAHIVKFRFSKWRKYRSISVGEMVDELPGGSVLSTSLPQGSLWDYVY